jgi:hypothetical protein
VHSTGDKSIWWVREVAGKEAYAIQTINIISHHYHSVNLLYQFSIRNVFHLNRNAFFPSTQKLVMLVKCVIWSWPLYDKNTSLHSFSFSLSWLCSFFYSLNFCKFLYVTQFIALRSYLNIPTCGTA